MLKIYGTKLKFIEIKLKPVHGLKDGPKKFGRRWQTPAEQEPEPVDPGGPPGLLPDPRRVRDQRAPPVLQSRLRPVWIQPEKLPWLAFDTLRQSWLEIFAPTAILKNSNLSVAWISVCPDFCISTFLTFYRCLRNQKFQTNLFSSHSKNILFLLK